MVGSPIWIRTFRSAPDWSGFERASAPGSDRRNGRRDRTPGERGKDSSYTSRRRAVQSASAGTPTEAERRADGGIESGSPGRSRSGGGQSRAMAHRRSMPVGGGAQG